jgi:hypothetical protein
LEFGIWNLNIGISFLLEFEHWDLSLEVGIWNFPPLEFDFNDHRHI